ncbi:hypothetical protein SJAG_05573 [Schizosaccharomyces japonicus yFS275]|uniref:Uncharacterized protein n=1 Tax=Schizosaccharomyces japonicus (strain yFS275 / FY16936) TaxID=402676 RepID=T0T6D1_SCHJY|nr:hypothetical protein SJAG_05573 [Schizosaccharomyces japonicus yFS275]EQC52974.1 hypothetical protein SJAG_05573 [Schizosaccharomyces japonicus yFS275]
MRVSLCRLAVKRVSVPMIFRQSVVLANGASFTFNSTFPRGSIASTKDVTNQPLYNPRTGLAKAIYAEESRVNRFKRRYQMK